MPTMSPVASQGVAQMAEWSQIPLVFGWAHSD